MACGTLVRIDQKSATARFWDPSKIEAVDRRDEDAAANLRAQTESAVADALDGGNDAVATYLSAGRDSGIVTAVAARQLGAQNRGLAAYTAVPIDGYGNVEGRCLYDERAGSAEVASLYPNLSHHLFRPGNFHLSAALDRANLHLASPYGTPVNLAWCYGIQSEAARRGARLILSGGTGNLTVSNGGPWAIPDLLDDSLLAWSNAMNAALRAPGPACSTCLPRVWAGVFPLRFTALPNMQREGDPPMLRRHS